MVLKEALQCYTVGHSDLDAEEFMALLTVKGIDLVVDARAYPYNSHIPHYDRDRLDALLHSRGISYIWMGRQLGCLTSEGRLDPIAREREASYQNGISELMDLLPERKVCVLSSESDWHVSHRHNLIAQTLMRYGIDVFHIELDGSVIPALPDLFHLEE